MKRTFILLGTFLALAGIAKAQESITPSILNSSGGSGTTGGMFYDWSVGEMVAVTTYYGPTIIVTQGILQNEISTPVGTPNAKLAQHVQVFPNPASSLVNVQYTSEFPGTLYCKLMDMTGRIIKNQTIAAKQGITTEQLNISTLAAATYMLEVSFASEGAAKETTAFKIDKLK